MSCPLCFKLTFPRDSMMSISPDAGHLPYGRFFGNIQIAGQIQSPLGSLVWGFHGTNIGYQTKI